MMLDIAIVGMGPAGLSAAIQARMRELSVTLIARADARSALSRAPLIENYPGCPNESGQQLLARMQAHAQGLGAGFHDGKVTSILRTDEGFGLGIGNDFLMTRSVILATGARQPKLLPGEEGLVGRGLSYCATCDGMLYRGKRVAVLGASTHAVQEANFLATLASEVLYFGKADPALHPDIRRIPAAISGILGTERVTGVTAGGETFEVDGLFIEREQMALGTLLSDLALEGAFIRVDRAMRTNLPRVYAAGDCAGGALQVSKAVGEGCVAAMSASEDLADA